MTHEEAISILRLNKDRMRNSVRMAIELLMEETEKTAETTPAPEEAGAARIRKRSGERAGVFRSMEVGDTKEVEFSDYREWRNWRVTAHNLMKTYGCLFSVRIKPDDRTRLTIARIL